MIEGQAVFLTEEQMERAIDVGMAAIRRLCRGLALFAAKYAEPILYSPCLCPCLFISLCLCLSVSIALSLPQSRPAGVRSRRPGVAGPAGYATILLERGTRGKGEKRGAADESRTGCIGWLSGWLL